MISKTLDSKQKEQLQGILKTRPAPKLLDPKEKIGEKIPKDFMPKR
jgi:hypothetical protein